MISELANSSNLVKLSLNFFPNSIAFWSYKSLSSHVFLGFRISLGTLGHSCGIAIPKTTWFL